MAIRLWGSKTPGNAQDTRDVTLMRNKKRVREHIMFQQQRINEMANEGKTENMCAAFYVVIYFNYA